MEKIDVSRLSVAECLALAEQQDADKQTGSTVDPVETMLEMIGGSAAGVTHAVRNFSLDLGLGMTGETSEAPLNELSRHMSSAAVLGQEALKQELLAGLRTALENMDEENARHWEEHFTRVFDGAEPVLITEGQVAAAANSINAVRSGHQPLRGSRQKFPDLLSCSRLPAAVSTRGDTP